jgi:hypothetical protein
MICSGVNELGKVDAPALQNILGQQHLLALFVDGAFGQPAHAPRSQHVIAMPELKSVYPQALALALAHLRPSGADIVLLVLVNHLHRRRA